MRGQRRAEDNLLAIIHKKRQVFSFTVDESETLIVLVVGSIKRLTTVLASPMD